MGETQRRREKQEQHNAENGLTPQALNKSIGDIMEGAMVVPGRGRKGRQKVGEEASSYAVGKDSLKSIKSLEDDMYKAAKDLDFERAAALRDQIAALKHGV